MSIFRNALDKRNRDEKGFTLIELLVVIIIIGILAAIAIPIFLNQRKKAVDASLKSDARTIATQIETFYTDGQIYPSEVEFVYTAPSGATPGSILIGSESVILSPGNAAAVTLNTADEATATAFCVIMTNDKGTRDYAWQSDAGGLLTTETCAAAFTTGLVL
ncbi:MAG: prepilin-type N-terminal cleavage/methylation domain-containing protein [Sporichthyaceae bacterium]